MHDLNCDTVVSYFDNQQGPRLLCRKPRGDIELDQSRVDGITKLMDLHESDDFFLHYYDGLLTVNYCFGIHDPSARGGEFMLMGSMIFHESKVDLGQIMDTLPVLKRRLKILAKSLEKNRLVRDLLNRNYMRTQNPRKKYKTMRDELVKVLKR